MVESYTYFKELEDRKREQADILKNVQDVIAQDYVQYRHCLKDIIEAKDDFAAVKSRVRAMLKNYPQQFKLDWMRFYDVMMEKCPLAIFVVLMDSDYRGYYLGTAEEKKAKYYEGLEAPTGANALVSCFSKRDLFQHYITNFGKCGDKSLAYITLDGKKSTSVIKTWLDNKILKEVDYSKSGGEWEDAVDKDTKIMIFYCGSNITIRPAGDKKHQIQGVEINTFPIFDGLDFRAPISKKPNFNQLLNGAKISCSGDRDKKLDPMNNILLYMEIK